MATTAGDWIDQVLHFWFTELKPEAWFTRDERVDAMIRERFGELHERLRSVRPPDLTTPSACLAAVIVFDQFSRNMFRGSPRSYASDALALSIARHAITAGFDRNLDDQQRVFLYMPFQHSENAATQARSVELFTELGDAETLDYARQHQAVIEKFGRFPHRNATLGRASTEAEQAFMRTHEGF